MILNNSLFDFLPPKLRQQLFDEFRRIHDAYILGHHQSTELNAARFCEIVYHIIAGYLNGSTYPSEAVKPTDFIGSCKALEKYPATFPYSARILMPRTLVILYDIRNHRDIGHVNGDISPSYIDATMSFKSASWVLAELVRIFYGLDMSDAEQLVNQLASTGNLPLVWNIDGRKRVLDPKMSSLDKTLVILYDAHTRLDKDLYRDVKYSSLSMFKRRVLDKGDEGVLWEYNRKTGLVTLSSLGAQRAEEIIRAHQ